MNLLKDKAILITKSKAEAEKSIRQLEELGAEIIYFPTIKIVPLANSPELDDALNMFGRFDYLVFTSANAVEVFSDIVKRRGLDLSNVKIAAVGSNTYEECENVGFPVDVMPDEFSTDGLLYKFAEFDLTNKKICIPGSSLSSGELNIGLSELGAQVFSVPIYDVVKNDLNNLKAEHHKIQKKHPGIFIFTSPSSFSNFLKLMNVLDTEKFFGKSVIAVIGSTTEKAIRKFGLTVHIVPNVFSLHGISEAIVKYFQTTINIA